MILSKLVPILAAVSITSATSAADSRSDWQGYDWQIVKRAVCPDLGSSAPCQLFHGKWDWKRNQWVDLMLVHRHASLEVEAILTNYDRKDDDFVCVVILFQDDAKANVAALHFNEHSDPNTASTATASFPLDAGRAGQISQIAIGTKQCREGADQDKDTYAGVLRGLRTR